MLFLLKKYKTYDEILCKPRTFIIKNCCYCAGELKARLNKSTRCIDLITTNESDLITKDENNNDLNAYEILVKKIFIKNYLYFQNLLKKKNNYVIISYTV